MNPLTPPYLILPPQILQRCLERALCSFPQLIASHRLLWAGAEVDLILLEPKRRQRVAEKLQHLADFAANLVGGAEHVAVVLGKASDAEEPVQLTGVLVPEVKKVLASQSFTYQTVTMQ